MGAQQNHQDLFSDGHIAIHFAIVLVVFLRIVQHLVVVGHCPLEAERQRGRAQGAGEDGRPRPLVRVAGARVVLVDTEGVRAVIVMPTTTPQLKIDAVKALGGELYDGGRRANIPAPGHSSADRSVSLLLEDDRVALELVRDGVHLDLDLCRWLVLPLALGQLARPWIAEWIKQHKARINVADRATILVLVYTSFCDSFEQGVWAGNGLGNLALVVVGSAVLFVLAMVATGWTARALGFSREDRIAAMFCGSKKTLASGVPMAKLIFGAHPAIGLILLPIMVYHPLQLLVCGVLAERWAKTDG